ncbi:MAG: 30S ribosomal protein S8 [Deltaproteobacteria bacterium CG_4_10_14_3_um_filter_60_8]|nr:MAG: 30S ribosomal protein S8 [Desulfobacterales bacterium CG2_30_60_27]PIP43964.1 MAG: 30S ribosomal protein S8 [Deltaproteobacteria bacterium CG23_combo_of_CG06-09_8_20_14_all_60_8]PIY20851.1 MAG: 30S ribosomal protein S8 [Deltaproteobacteria bacterium CG_4_10_14_3_um_filter_60_8]
MSMSDPLADMLTRIRNAGMAKFKSVDMPKSRLKVNVATTLKKEGYIADYQVIDDAKRGTLRVTLKYDSDNHKVITNLRRVSKPGRRVYVKADGIPKVMSGLGVAIISTSKGIVADREARTLGLGGELLCEVW